MSTVIAPSACPKWEGCNAPLCPLDPDLFKRVMHDGDAVCHYLIEAVKADAEANFRGRDRIELFEVISPLIHPMTARWGRIRKALARARTSGSRMARLAPWEVDRGT
jgi:hypothetical protein